jgi:hypothetical protein
MQNRRKIIAVAVVLAVGGLAWLSCKQLPAPAVATKTLPATPSQNAGAILAANSTPAASIAANPSPAEQRDPAAPPAGLTAALQLPNGVDRLNAIDHVLRAWAATSPAGALAWARTQDSSLRQNAIMSVLRGMGAQPQTAARLGLLLISQEPAMAGDYRLALIQGLADARQFSFAFQVADTASPDSRAGLHTLIFESWGAVDHASALRMLAADPPEYHNPDFAHLAQGWSLAQPVTFADYAMTLPPGPDRQGALNLLTQWGMSDPAGFSAWVARQAASSDLDGSILTVLRNSDSANQPLEVAMNMARGISDPALQLSGAESVVKQWSKDDASATLSYVQSAPWLSSDQRVQLIQTIHNVTAPPQ